MKKILLLLSISFILVSCDSNSPKDTAKKFTETMAKGDLDGAKIFMTPGSASVIDMVKKMSGDSIPKFPDYKFEMIKDSIVGDSIAWVTYTTPNGNVDELNLVKREGMWKVSMSGK